MCSTSLLYKILQTNLVACKQAFKPFTDCKLHWVQRRIWVRITHIHLISNNQFGRDFGSDVFHFLLVSPSDLWPVGPVQWKAPLLSYGQRTTMQSSHMHCAAIYYRIGLWMHRVSNSIKPLPSGKIQTWLYMEWHMLPANRRILDELDGVRFLFILQVIEKAQKKAQFFLGMG